jgi:hypothetical protein
LIGLGFGSDLKRNLLAIHLCPNLLHDTGGFLRFDAPRVSVLGNPTYISCNKDSPEAVVIGGAFWERYSFFSLVGDLPLRHLRLFLCLFGFDNSLDVKVRVVPIKVNIKRAALLFPFRGLAIAASRSMPWISSSSVNPPSSFKPE